MSVGACVRVSVHFGSLADQTDRQGVRVVLRCEWTTCGSLALLLYFFCFASRLAFFFRRRVTMLFYRLFSPPVTDQEG